MAATMWGESSHVFSADSGWSSSSDSIKSSDGIVTKFETLTNIGDSTLITITSGSSRKYVLVDTGKTEVNVAGKLAARGIKRIMSLIVTHNHGDHINGLRNFSEYGIKVLNLFYSYVNSRPSEQFTFDALAYIKGFKNTVVNGKATRIGDAQNHSETKYNINMESNSSEYLRVCRGRL